MDARAVVVYTRSGHTARLVVAVPPAVPIYAFTADESVRRRLALYWGVQPLLTWRWRATRPRSSAVSDELAARGVWRAAT